MTKAEAKLFFPYEEDDDLENLWEERFFALKQYFLTHAPIWRVWESKIKRLQKQFEAYCVLMDISFENSVEEKPIVVDFKESSDYILMYHHFQESFYQAKLKLAQAQTPKELANGVKEMLLVEYANATYWATPSSYETELKVAQSQSVDPIEFLEGLQQVRTHIEISTIDELKTKYNLLPEVVQKEVKRLSLLVKIK